MPYTLDNPPDRIKGLPKHAQEIWIKAYNAAAKQYDGNEQKANEAAWAAVKKAGYYKNEEGKWVMKGEFGFEIGELCSEEIKIKPVIDLKQLIEGDSKPFFPIIKSVKVGESRNKKIYSMENLLQIEKQLPLYGYKGHIKEEDIGTVFREPVTIWIGGEIIGDWLYIKGYVPAEEESLRRKIAMSLKVGKPMPVSILGWYRQKAQGESFKVEDIRMISIDWGNAGLEGVLGAQVVEIASEEITKEDDMPTKEEILAALTSDEIKKGRPDLVESIQSEMQESAEAKKKREDEEKKSKELEKENVDLKKKIIDAHREKLLAEIKDEKVREIAGDLLQGETVEDLDKNWKLVKEKLSKIEKPGMPVIDGTDEELPGSDFIKDRYLEKKEA